MLGTYRALLLLSKSRCFASKNQSWGRGHIEASNSDANHAVLNAKTTDEGWDPQRLVILMLSTLLYMHKMTGHVWDP